MKGIAFKFLASLSVGLSVSTLCLANGVQCETSLAFLAYLHQGPFERPQVLRAGPIVASGEFFVYFETRHIKDLRDLANLSPNRVDELITNLKSLFLRNLQNSGLKTTRIELDYKGVHLQFEKFHRETFEKVLEMTAADFLSTLGPTESALLMSLPNYQHPFSVGVGATAKQAGIASRYSYTQPETRTPILNVYEEVKRELQAHSERVNTLRGEAVNGLLNEIPSSRAQDLLYAVNGQFVLSPALNSLIRKSKNPVKLAAQLAQRFNLSGPISLETARALIAYFQAVRVFEPPLEYTEAQKTDIVGPLPTKTAEKVRPVRDGFLISADIRDVGAHHATQIQSLLVPSEAHPLNIDVLVEQLTYGRSLERMNFLLTRTSTVIESAFSKELCSPQMLKSKSSGDEVVMMYDGLYSAETLHSVLSHVPSEARLTIIRTPQQVHPDWNPHELRHLGEAMAKSFYDSLLAFGKFELANDLKVLVEIAPFDEQSPKFSVRVLLKAGSAQSDHLESLGSVLLSAQETLVQDLKQLGIPQYLLDHMQALKFEVVEP